MKRSGSFENRRFSCRNAVLWVAAGACFRLSALHAASPLQQNGERAVQPAPVTVTSSVDRTKITIGDLIRYTVTVEHDEEIEVEMPGLGQNLGGFEIRDYEVLDPGKRRGRITRSVRYTISTFFTGEFVIPPLTVMYSTADDSIKKMLTTEDIKVVVESVKPREAGDIRDIKPPLEIPADPWRLIRWILMVVGVLGLVGLAVWLHRRKKAGKGLLPVREAAPRPPHVVALESLDRLRNEGVKDLMAYYIDISGIIRQYIGGRYFLVAMEMTTSDVLEGLQEEAIPEAHYEMFDNFLRRCDLVKFAKTVPGEAENQMVLELAYDIVNSTKVILDDSPTESGEGGEGEPGASTGEETDTERDAGHGSGPDASAEQPAPQQPAETAP